jgi:F-type H+-transporting ATPase subunit delta
VRDVTVSRNYAETLFELALRHEGLEVYGDAMARVATILDENPEARAFLETPRISSADKKRVVRKALEGTVPQAFVNFLLIVIDKRRQRLIRDIAREFFALMDEHMGRLHVEVTLARAPAEGVEDQIASTLSEILGKQAIPHLRVKPSILGGILVKAGDTVYDGTLQRRMATLRRKLLATSLPSA